MEINNTWIQQQPGFLQCRDWVQELDNETAKLDPETKSILSENQEYQNLYSELQGMIQLELSNLIRPKLNSLPAVVENIKRQLDILGQTKSEVQENQRKSLSELNDYIQNYPQLTFEEYRKLKQNETGRDKTKN